VCTGTLVHYEQAVGGLTTKTSTSARPGGSATASLPSAQNRSRAARTAGPFSAALVPAR